MNLAPPDHSSPSTRFRLTPFLISTLITALVAHLIIFAPLPISLRAWAVLLLTGFLPGLLLVEWLVGSRAEAPLDLWERILYSLGAGAGIIVVTMLLLS